MFEVPISYRSPSPSTVRLLLLHLPSYTQNGLLHMLDRNRRIKKCPERFQETKEQFDIIITVEERVYDLVVMHMESMDSVDNRPVHVLNVDVVDNAEDALMGAFLITDMLNLVRDPSLW